MRAFTALYRKEFKAVQTLFFFLIAATVVLDLYLLLAGDARSSWVAAAFLPHVALIVVTPFLLAHQYSVEWTSGTGQFLFSLPVPVWHTGVAKFLATLTFALIWFLFNTLGTQLIYLRFFAEDLYISGGDFWIFFAASELSLLLFLLGVAVPVTAVRWAVKRLRWLMATLAFFLILYLTVKVMGRLFPLLSEWFPSYEVSVRVAGEEGLRTVQGTIEIAQSVALALWGLLWAALGLWVMDRFGEF